MTAKGSNPNVLSDDDIYDFYKKKEKDIDINILKEFYSNIIFTFKEKITDGDYKYIIEHLEILKKRIDSFIENIEYEKDVNVFNIMVDRIKNELLTEDISKIYKKTISYKKDAYILLETGDKITDFANHIDVTLYLVYKENKLYILKDQKYTNKFSKTDQYINELIYDIYSSDDKVNKLLNDCFNNLLKLITRISTTKNRVAVGGMKKVSYKLNSDNVKKKLLHNNKKHRSIK